MRIAKYLAAPILWIALGLLVPSAAFAQQASSANATEAKNAIESIQAVKNGGSVVLRVTLKQPLDTPLGSFSVSTRPASRSISLRRRMPWVRVPKRSMKETLEA